jgi:hypothetical protein
MGSTVVPLDGNSPGRPQTSLQKISLRAGLQWLTPVVLPTWEAEIRRILVQGYPRQIVTKNPTHLQK